jgi:polyketide synthase PksM/rhizoxin synthesis polyketide synthase RhiD
VNLTIHPGKFGALRTAGILADGDQSRAFGQGGGLLPGEGVGAVVLKPLSNALADGDFIYGVILGSSANHGGKTSGYRVPSAEAQGELIGHAVRQAGIDPESLTYIEAAANGSPLGDPLEISGLRRGLGAVAAAIGSVKSNIGHLEAASGISQLTKVLGQLRGGLLYPTIHAEPRNPELGMEQTNLRLVTQLQPWDAASPRRAAISSFG